MIGRNAVQIGGRRVSNEEEDIVSLDLTETCRNSSVAGGRLVPNSRQIKKKLKEKETRSRKKSKVKYHVKSAVRSQSRDYDDAETVKEHVVVGSSALFDAYLFKANQINSPFKEKDEERIPSEQLGRKLLRKSNTLAVATKRSQQ